MIIAGTGHRPKYLPCKYNDKHPWLLLLKEKLRIELTKLSPEAVISGMAIGWDTWLAQCALELNVPVWAYVPFPEQGSTWPTKSKKEYQNIIDKSAIVLYTSDSYNKECFFTRDRKMMEDCDHVFSLLDPNIKSGGTYYTVQYAKKLKLPITNFWSDNESD